MKKARKPSPTESPLLFEIDPEPLPEKLTALGGVPLLVQTFRSLVAIVRKRLGLKASLYQILQILSVTLFEKTPILRALQASDFENDLGDPGNQLNLFDF